MNSTSGNSISSDSASDNNCFHSKLRRYKIQEGVLTANVNKCFLLNSEDNEGHIKYNDDARKLKKYFSKLKDNFQEIKHLFEEIKLKTNEQDSFDKTDIDELKRDILGLETKIRTAKQFIGAELQTLRNEEITLLEKREASETLSSEERKFIRHDARIPQIKGFKGIVSSPVRVIINSPFKCSEVQQFHDFMKNSHNRYGGWNEYNHTTFIQIWNKYYGDNNMTMAVRSIEETFSYEDFKEEVFQKISGSSLDSIDTHSKWYFEYLQLKLKQQRALSKWQENKRKIKPSQKIRLVQSDDTIVNESKTQFNNIKLCRKQNHSNAMGQNTSNGRNGTNTDTFMESIADHNLTYRNKTLNSLYYDSMKESTVSNSGEVVGINKKNDITRLLKPTKQWLKRQESEKETYEFNKSLESIPKLRTPNWRLNLRE